MRIVPLNLKEANTIVKCWHRHHKPVVGHRFSIGAVKNNKIVGVAISGRPIARLSVQRMELEILRVTTDGTKNACSFLLGAVGRIAKNMGYAKVKTTTLSKESGASLKAVGWSSKEMGDGSGWDSRPNRNVDCKSERKVQWSKVFISQYDDFAFPEEIELKINNNQLSF
tara:strand:+ start:31 stop:537 length:507 start_codon:yes stop_codon:yes gene_type:complete